jgi:hypothetical protein
MHQHSGKIAPVKRRDVVKGRQVKFAGPKGIAHLTAEPSQHLLTDCVGQIVMGPSEDVWCYPDSPELDMVWVAFADDIRPIRQVSAAWLETV